MHVRDFVALAATLALSDLVARAVKLPLHKWAARLRLPLSLVPWVLVILLAPIPLRWPDRHFSWMLLGLLFVLSWRIASEDIDIADPDARWSERLLLIATSALSILNPVFLLPNLWVQFTRFDAFKHHCTLPLRTLMIGSAFTIYWNVTSPLGVAPIDVAPGMIVIVTCQAFAYGIAARAKAQLTPHWYSWILENRLHYLVASAYSWGWARFIDERTWIRLVRLLGRVNVPMQLVAFTVEASSVLVLLDPRLALLSMLAASGLHVVIYLVSGILFWEWIVTNIALMWFISVGEPAMLARMFGWEPFLCSLAIMAIFLRMGTVWRPRDLGWWDTTFTQRVHWAVVGVSGTVYGLYNDFLCPHERLYGRIHGYFLTDHKVCTMHLGQVKNRELREAIWTSNGEPEALSRIKEEWGKLERDDAASARERDYLTRLFIASNAGRRKKIYPRGLRWLKAPGGQYYYWGRMAGYRGQERVARVLISYREEFFDGERYRTITDEPLCEFEIPADA